MVFSGYSCEFATGDGVGGTEIRIGYQPTPQACIDACVHKKKTDPKINGATTTPCGSGLCYCEKKMRSSDGNHVNYIWKIKKIVGARFKYFFIYLMTLKYLRDYGRLAE